MRRAKVLQPAADQPYVTRALRPSPRIPSPLISKPETAPSRRRANPGNARGESGPLDPTGRRARHRLTRTTLAPAQHRQGRPSKARLTAAAFTAAVAGIATLLPAAGHPSPTRPTNRPRDRLVGLLAAAQPPASASPSSTPPPPAGNPRATITAPTDGTTVSAGTSITLTATLSDDLVTALTAGTGGACYFSIGDDANSAARATLDLTARTCTRTWIFSYASSYLVSASVTTPSGITYVAAPITVTAAGSANSRCTGLATAPATCTYHWTEVYDTSPTNTRHSRVCDIEGGCQWQSTHTTWRQVPGKDYWINDTGQPLPDGNAAEAYLCLGSTPTAWTSYASTPNLSTLLSRPETSAAPIPAGTC